MLPEKTIGACYGDAFLAGLAVGAVNGLDALQNNWVKGCQKIQPNAGI